VDESDRKALEIYYRERKQSIDPKLSLKERLALRNCCNLS